MRVPHHTLACSNPPARRDAGPTGPTPGPLLFGRLLAYFLAEIADPGDRAWVEKLLDSDPRWRAHARSARDLDLELTAARHAARELARFSPDSAHDFCRAAAATAGRILDEVIRRSAARVGRWRAREWERHIDACVYCRRMKRARLARIEARLEGLPEGELLLRDWAVEQVCREPLDQATRRLLGEALEPTLPVEADIPTIAGATPHDEPSEREDRSLWGRAVASARARHREGPLSEALDAVAERLRAERGPAHDVVDRALQQALGKDPQALRRLWMELQTARFGTRAPS